MITNSKRNKAIDKELRKKIKKIKKQGKSKILYK